MSHFYESSISNFIPNNDRNLTLEIKIIVQFTIDAVDFYVSNNELLCVWWSGNFYNDSDKLQK